MSLRYLFAASLVFGLCARADVRMPAIFGDHMVLQQGSTIPVWGWAEPGERVTVSFDGQKVSGVADSKGKWRIDLRPISARRNANEPGKTLSIQGKGRTIELGDVLVGEVWLASGQSNMEFGIQSDLRAQETIANAKDDQIRFFFVPWATSLTPKDDLGSPRGDSRLDGRWVVCSPSVMESSWAWHGFSAVAYYFGQEVRASTGMPVGLIGSYKGGTPAEPWTSVGALKSDPLFSDAVAARERFIANFDAASKTYPAKKAEYDREVRKWNDEVGTAFKAAEAAWRTDMEKARAEGRPEPQRPQPARPQPRGPAQPDGGFGTAGNLFNAMISPLIPYGIRGVIWYQGESNGDNRKESQEYATLFPLMIKDWRAHWGQGDFPFLFVQLANYKRPAQTPSEGNWAWVREAQFKTLALPLTGMASAVDVGDADDIHPKNKYTVGKRLGLVARGMIYKESIVSSGPLYGSMSRDGRNIRIKFNSVGGGLQLGEDGKAGPELTGFGIAGKDRKFVWAKAVIEGDSVRVWSESVGDPVAVRYGWADNPTGNLYNKAGLPASPFRTDDWKE